jgi:ketosteroid isomerase-like protein
MNMNDIDWLNSLFASIDAMDSQRFVAHLTPDAEFQFGNLPTIQGTEHIKTLVQKFFEGMRGLRHTLLEQLICGNTLVCRGVVTYFRHDGSEVSVPFANIMRRDGERASEYRIYCDVSPLFV